MPLLPSHSSTSMISLIVSETWFLGSGPPFFLLDPLSFFPVFLFLHRLWEPSPDSLEIEAAAIYLCLGPLSRLLRKTDIALVIILLRSNWTPCFPRFLGVTSLQYAHSSLSLLSISPHPLQPLPPHGRSPRSPNPTSTSLSSLWSQAPPVSSPALYPHLSPHKFF